MKYEDMVKKIIATAWRPDGYNGKQIKVGIALHKGTLYAVHRSGYHNVFQTDVPPVNSLFEALRKMDEHRGYYETKPLRPEPPEKIYVRIDDFSPKRYDPCWVTRELTSKRDRENNFIEYIRADLQEEDHRQTTLWDDIEKLKEDGHISW